MLSLQFESIPNFTYSQIQQQAEKSLQKLKIQACQKLPSSIRSKNILTSFEQIKKTQLYAKLKSLPKACLHHIHFDCCEDQQFYAKYIVNDPIVYLSSDEKSFKLGSKELAEKQGWISMNQIRKRYTNQQQFINKISNLTMFSQKQLQQNFSLNSQECWQRFQVKLQNMFPLLGVKHILQKYTAHSLKKFIKNGYDRVQFRFMLSGLTEYNEMGQIVKVHEEKKFMDMIDQVVQQIRKQHPSFSVGFIFFGLKMFSPEQNQKVLTAVLEKNWDKTIGIDFVQQQDLYGSQKPYDQVVDKVLAKFPQKNNIKKVYHAGQTQDHQNNNIKVAIEGGSVRIGHGVNIIQHSELLKTCKQKNICFEQNPISNLVLGYVNDPRCHPTQLLLGLGIPLTINPDDPARFGLEDNTMDYFTIFINSNWSLKHLKLIAIYSINFAICSEQIRSQMLKSFNQRWNQWINVFNQKQNSLSNQDKQNIMQTQKN